MKPSYLAVTCNHCWVVFFQCCDSIDSCIVYCHGSHVPYPRWAATKTHSVICVFFFIRPFKIYLFPYLGVLAPPKQGLFQSKEGAPFGFQVEIMKLILATNGMSECHEIFTLLSQIVWENSPKYHHGVLNTSQMQGTGFVGTCWCWRHQKVRDPQVVDSQDPIFFQIQSSF